MTKGKDPQGRVVRGWGAFGTVRRKQTLKNQSDNAGRRRKPSTACIKEQTDFTLKVDAALRFAIAQLRFVVAEPRVTSCAATSQGRLPALCSK